MTPAPAAVPCEPWRELALHVLAHVPLRDAGSLFDRGYLQWAATLGLHEPTLLHDGAVIAGVVADRPASPIHRVPLLFASLAAFERVRGRGVAELDAADVDDPSLLAALRAAAHPASSCSCWAAPWRCRAGARSSTPRSRRRCNARRHGWRRDSPTSHRHRSPPPRCSCRRCWARAAAASTTRSPSVPRRRGTAAASITRR
ncbi:MAG: hypothetical protein U0168_11000 [Nannocystaceae bacterium]